MTKPLVLIAAGGTGGHLFPAEALATALKRHDARVVLASDHRVADLAGSFPAAEMVRVRSATPSGRSPLQIARAMLVLSIGLIRAVQVIRSLKPAVVVGFGGYPTVPPVLAASLLRVPAVVHEQNGVMGRANRFLARRVAMIATGFPRVRGIPENTSAKVVHTGNPVRPAVLESARAAYPAVTPSGPWRLLVFGGSQGARVMSEIVPEAVARLPKELRPNLHVTQQARPEDLQRVRDQYRRLGVSADVQSFFKDLPQRMAEAHLVISRSGASTVAELAVIGRPSILVPLPGALDQDQAVNAQALAERGAATVLLQDAFTPERLAHDILTYVKNPLSLTQAAAAAKSAGVPDAAERLATQVLRLATA